LDIGIVKLKLDRHVDGQPLGAYCAVPESGDTLFYLSAGACLYIHCSTRD